MIVDLVKELQSVGFSEKQAKVYVACLELGPSPVQAIAARAGLVRPTTYVILGELQVKGVMNEVVMKKKKMFASVSPENIFALLKREQVELERRTKKFQETLTHLRKDSGKGNQYPRVSIYEGFEGIEKLRSEINNLPAKFFNQVIPLDLAYSVFPPSPKDHRKSINPSRKPSKIIYSSKKFSLSEDSHKKVQKIKNLDISTEMVITDTRVYFFDFDSNMMAVSIDHPGIVGVLNSIYKIAWNK